MTKRLTSALRTWLLIDCVLVFCAGVQLFVFTERTDRLFAWTIAPPLTAAFLGASYWASLPLLYLSSRRIWWADARLAIYGVLVFTTLTTVATIVHIERFHLFAPTLEARIAAWIWMLVYAIVPPVLARLLVLQLRAPGGDPARRAAIPHWIRQALGLQAAILLSVGVGLFCLQARALWPWTLTPLTSRAVGAWLVGIGIIAAQARWENDLVRVRPAMFGLTSLAILHLVVLARFGAFINWAGPRAFIYTAFACSILLVAALGWTASRNALGPHE